MKLNSIDLQYFHRVPTVMENHEKPLNMKKIISRPGKVTENENLAKSHGQVIEFVIFTNISHISREKNVLNTCTFDTQWH